MIGGKLKNQLLLAVFVIGLTSCISTATLTTTSTFTPAPTETFFPTAFYTVIPTDTSTPTKIPTTATVTTEPTPYTSFGTMRILGENSEGKEINGHPYDFFHTFFVQPSEFALFRFSMLITTFHFIKDGFTPTPTAIPTEKWRISIYRYRTDGAYVNQPVIDTNFKTDVMPYPDKLLMYLTTDVSMEAVQTKFGDCSAFTYQVLDGQGKIQQQGYFSINPHHLFTSGGGLMGNVNDGVTLGFPYSLNEIETEFFHQGKFVTINEPKSGFYRLTYDFSFTGATGVYGTDEQVKLASEITIRFYPYTDEGNYSTYNAYPTTGRLSAVTGIYQVNLPIDYLKENASINNKYYLQVVDGKGNVLRDEYFLFIPYAP